MEKKHTKTIMGKVKNIVIVVLLLIIALAVSLVAILTACQYAKTVQSEKHSVITFDTDGGDYIEPWTVYSKLYYENLPRPFKADSVFLGWTYKGDYIDEVEDSSIGLKDITVKAKWQKADSVEVSRLSESVLAKDSSITDVYLTFARNGYSDHYTR